MRDNWEFAFDIDTLIDAAIDKVDWHGNKLEYYKSETEKAEKDLRENGVEVRESLNLRNTYSTQQNLNIVVDPQKQHHLEACQAKVREHQEKLHEYETWVRAFEAKKTGWWVSKTAKDRILNLTIDDIKFFGL